MNKSVLSLSVVGWANLLMASLVSASLAGVRPDGRPPIYRASHFTRKGPRSRYMPHQGDRECARRRRQMLKAFA